MTANRFDATGRERSEISPTRRRRDDVLGWQDSETIREELLVRPGSPFLVVKAWGRPVDPGRSRSGRSVEEVRAPRSSRGVWHRDPPRFSRSARCARRCNADVRLRLPVQFDPEYLQRMRFEIEGLTGNGRKA